MDAARSLHAAGDYKGSSAAFQGLAAAATKAGDRLLAARATANVGAAAAALGDHAAAVEHFGRAVAMMDAEGSLELARAVRTNMALSLEKAGEIDGAAAASDKGACVADAGGAVGPPAAVR